MQCSCCNKVLSRRRRSALTLLDRQVPTRSVMCRRRLSSVWFDDECRRAKRAMHAVCMENPRIMLLGTYRKYKDEQRYTVINLSSVHAHWNYVAGP